MRPAVLSNLPEDLPEISDGSESPSPLNLLVAGAADPHGPIAHLTILPLPLLDPFMDSTRLMLSILGFKP